MIFISCTISNLRNILDKHKNIKYSGSNTYNLSIYQLYNAVMGNKYKTALKLEITGVFLNRKLRSFCEVTTHNL